MERDTRAHEEDGDRKRERERKGENVAGREEHSEIDFGRGLRIHYRSRCGHDIEHNKEHAIDGRSGRNADGAVHGPYMYIHVLELVGLELIMTQFLSFSSCLCLAPGAFVEKEVGEINFPTIRAQTLEKVSMIRM